jgi:hypothetical protein
MKRFPVSTRRWLENAKDALKAHKPEPETLRLAGNAWELFGVETGPTHIKFPVV